MSARNKQVRKGDQLVLYQCAFCHEIDDDSQSHLHAAKDENAPHHKRKRIIMVTVDSTKLDKIR